MNKISLDKILKGDVFNNFSELTTTNDLKKYFADENLSSYRLSKKSKVYVVDYFNLRFIFENNLLIIIQINFEGNSTLLVENDFFNNLSKKETIIYLYNNNWIEKKISDTILFKKNDFKLSFNEEKMELHLLTINLS